MALNTLGYWNTRSIAEPIRLLLHYCEVDFIDKRYQVGPPPAYDKSSWSREKHSLGLVIPNLPYYLEPATGLKLTQTHAILAYIAECHGLAGTSPRERATAHMAIEALRDWSNAFAEVTYCNANPNSELCEAGVHREGAECASQTSPRFDRLRRDYLKSTLPEQLDMFARLLVQGGTSWVAGSDKPTHADFVLAETLDQNNIFASGGDEVTEAIGDYMPQTVEIGALLDFRARFEALPQVIRYRQSGSFKAEPLHNRYSHFHTGWSTK